ncbi:hypothetical protein ACIQGO_12215 [Streptomyces shenzhenensis]
MTAQPLGGLQHWSAPLHQSMAENGVVRQELSEESAWSGRRRSRKAAG